MTVIATPDAKPPLLAARRLRVAAFVVLAMLPLAMVVANKSGVVLLTVAAGLAVLAKALAGELPQAVRILGHTLSRPLAVAVGLFLLLAALSLGWTQHGRVSAAALGEASLALAAALLLHHALPRDVPRGILLVAAAAIALGCGLIVAELATALSVRQAIGVRSADFIFKRPSITLLLVVVPLAALFVRTGRRWLGAGLCILVLIAIVQAHSGAALIGAVAGGAATAILVRSRTLAVGAVTLALLASLAIAPRLGNVAAQVLPDRLVNALESMQARDRIAIWQSFGEVVARRPVLGTGFGTSAAMARDAVAAEVPENRRVLLGAWHPHNGYLQIWAELGLPGAVLAGAALLLLGRALARWPRADLAAPLAVVAAAGTIMLVGHGAWQGWWIASLGAAAIWCKRIGSTPDSQVSPAGPPRSPR